MYRTVALLTLVLSSACFFEFDRGTGLGPGDAEGTGVLTTGESAAFMKVRVDGTGRVIRADANGRFVVRGLTPGTWALLLDHDRDGWPEEVARDLL